MIRCRPNIFKICLRCIRWRFIVATIICISLRGRAQNTDTNIVALNEVVITSVKSKQFNSPKKIQTIDSIAKQNFNQSSLSDLLAVNTPVFIKNYGPANLSSASFRGGNASQTPVLWNGFNLQNPMLGQNDFSQLPSFIFDNVSIEYGGSSAAWGSGAMGGSIHLNNITAFDKGISTLITMGLGSFNTKKLNTQLHYSNKKISSTTKAYYNSSKNNFDFLDTIPKQQNHANYLIKGFLQEFSYIPYANHQINIRAWYNQSNRNLPSTQFNKISKASQFDENIKLTADWAYLGRRITSSARVAYFDDVLNYTDSASSLFSNNQTKSLIYEADAKYQLNPSHQFYIGTNFTNYKGITVNYNKPVTELNKQAVIFGYNLNLLSKKLIYELQIRQEFSNAFKIPLTGNTGVSYQVIKSIKLKANVAKVYRLPTLNDLYWGVGGNPNLLPEDGYTYEGGFDIKLSANCFMLQSEMTYFNKTISNWISWVPGPGGNPTPINLAQVNSKGSETSSSISYHTKDLKCRLGFNSAYVLSNSIKSNLENDASVNKQLIYTPRYNYGANLTIVFDQLMVAYYHNYIGYRFTSSDNSSWLEPYNVASFKMAYNFKINYVMVTSTIHVNNLFNTSYVVVAQRPMPLRNYEFSLTLTYHKSKSTEKSNI